MNSIVKIYKDSLILEEKNFIVDDIEDYLATLTDTITLTGFQYIKHAATIEIKINKSQTYLDMKAANDYNYVSIQNQQNDGTGKEKKVYYFVSKMSWGASETLRLTLILDSINTFRIGTDFTLSKKTLIKREHRDRWKLISDGTTTKTYTATTYCLNETGGVYHNTVQIRVGGTNITVNSVSSNGTTTTATIDAPYVDVYVENDDPFEQINIVLNVTLTRPSLYQRIIDPVAEGIDAVLFKKSEENIIDNVDTNWYLIFKNQNAVQPTYYKDYNPIDVYLVPETPVYVKKYAPIELTTADLSDGDFIQINSYINNKRTIKVKGVITSPASEQFFTIWKNHLDGTHATVYNETQYLYESRYYSFVICKENGNSKLVCYTMNSIYNDDFDITSSASMHKYEFDKIVLEYDGGDINCYKGTGYTDVNSVNVFQPIANDSITATLSTKYTTNNIQNVDRTDNQIVKILMTPYIPVDFEFKDSCYILGNGWSLDAYGFIKYESKNVEFFNNIVSTIKTPLEELFLKRFTISTTAARNDTNESKLFHSDYYQTRIVYDSFVFPIMLENLDETADIFQTSSSKNFDIEWYVTNTINSRFLMKFPQLKYKRSTQDYDNILYINRNNEISLYNSAFVDYMRNGINYDIKVKEMNNNQMRGAAAIGMIGSFVGLSIKNPMTAGSAIGQATSNLQTAFNYAFQSAKAEMDIEQKILNAKDTAVAVSPADDVDLLKRYSQFAKSIIYSASDLVKKAVADLFYYCGYTRNIQGTPSVDTRYWFNFLQADIRLATTNNIADEIIADIVSKYGDGVTFIHHHTTWDFAQEKENWEVSLL